MKGNIVTKVISSIASPAFSGILFGKHHKAESITGKYRKIGQMSLQTIYYMLIITDRELFV